MKNEIMLFDEKIEYCLKRSFRARYMRLTIGNSGNLVVTAPYGLAQEIIERFLSEKAKWITDKIEHFKKFPAKFFVGRGKRHYIKHKTRALGLAGERVRHFNQFYGFKLGRISVKNQKSRWGSCSRKGNLNFNYNIALLPQKLADYIIVHELCHLGEFNHSKKFWQLVGRAIPDYNLLRRELKRGMTLK